MNRFNILLTELDEWNFAGQEATLWWRDDDATKAGDALIELLSQASSYDVPVSLAAVPVHVEQSLADCVADYPLVSVLQHGIAHRNQAAADRKKQELVAGAEAQQTMGGLTAGIAKLQEIFGSRLLPVLVPPWNRIDADLVPQLGHAGYKGLSCFGPRDSMQVDDELWVVNTHVDLVDWKQGKRFAGIESVLAQLVGHLQKRRLGEVDFTEPTGILSHHLDHDSDGRQFIGELMAVLDEHPAATWLSAERVFQPGWR